MTLPSGDIRFMRIFAEVPWGGASNDSGVVDNGNYFFGNFRGQHYYVAYAVFVSFSVISKHITLNDLE